MKIKKVVTFLLIGMLFLNLSIPVFAEMLPSVSQDIVGAEDPGGGYFPTAYYSTKVNGILSPNNTAFIEKLSTTHQGGSYFPFTDY